MKADQMKSINGTTDNMGQRSQGDQELDQRTFVNLQSGNQQKVAFLNKFIDRLFGPDTRVEMKLNDGTKVKINKDLNDRLNKDLELRDYFLRTGEIPGLGKAKEVQEKEKKEGEEEEKSYNIDGSLRDKTDPRTYPSGLGTGI